MFALAVLVLGQAPAADKWEKEIAAIEAKHKDATPGGIAFIGSSSIRLWDLKKSFPDWNAYNLGFGGSEIRHSTQYAQRTLVPRKPKAVVFYAGDNDIAAKRTPQQVKDDFAEFVKLVHAELPTATIYWLPVKPSLKREALLEMQKEANALVKQAFAKDPLVVYVDLEALHYTDGKLDAKYFKDDKLHLSPEGYAKWNEVLKKVVK
jgi:lysophospholipase L1-like esterase